MAKETKTKATSTGGPKKRVLAMEFDVETAALPSEVFGILAEQFGSDEAVPPKVKVLIPVGSGNGGPKEVIDSNAKVGGRVYRAIAKTSFDAGFETVPPEPSKLGLKPLG